MNDVLAKRLNSNKDFRQYNLTLDLTKTHLNHPIINTNTITTTNVAVTNPTINKSLSPYDDPRYSNKFPNVNTRLLTKETSQNNHLSIIETDKLNNYNHEKGMGDIERYRIKSLKARGFNPKKDNQILNISNYFDKSEIKNSILHADSIDDKIKVIDHILKKRNELQDLASKIATTKAAPVIKDFRDKFKLKKTISKKKNIMNFYNSKSSTNEFNSSPDESPQLKNSKILLVDSIPKQNEKSPVNTKEIRHENNNNAIVESDNSSALCSFIDTSRLFESAARAKDNLKYDDDEHVFKHIAYIQTSRSRLMLDKKEETRKPLLFNPPSTKIRSRLAPRYSKTMILNKTPTSIMYQLQDSMEKYKDNTKEKKEVMPQLPYDALESIWSFEKDQKEYENSIIDNIQDRASPYGKTSSKTKLMYRRENKIYTEYAKKKLEKDLINYSISNTQEPERSIFIDQQSMSNKMLKQIEKQAKKKVDSLFNAQSEFRTRLVDKIQQQKSNENMLSEYFTNTEDQNSHRNYELPMNIPNRNYFKQPKVLKVILSKSSSLKRSVENKKSKNDESIGISTERSLNTHRSGLKSKFINCQDPQHQQQSDYEIESYRGKDSGRGGRSSVNTGLITKRSIFDSK